MKIIYKSRVLVLLVLMVGCRNSPPLPPYDNNKAEETLAIALDFWKQGHADMLAKRNPPIRFEDEDYRNGFRLVDYRVDKQDSPIFQFNDVKVLLIMQDRRANKIEKNVVYQIAIEPGLAVLRND
jgi:hypothetical protein